MSNRTDFANSRWSIDPILKLSSSFSSAVWAFVDSWVIAVPGTVSTAKVAPCLTPVQWMDKKLV